MKRLAVLALLGSSLVLTPAAKLAASSCETQVNNTYQKLLDCVTLDGARAHQAALQAIADANNGIRTSGTPGYDQSADYAEAVFREAGYVVTRQNFQFQTFITLTSSVLAQVAPAPAGQVAHTILSYSGSGDVTAPVSAPSGDARGCYAADYAGFAAGNVALVSRGTPAGFPGGACTFAIKATNAFNAGAGAVIIYNNAPGAPNFTLGAAFTLNISVVGVTQALGQQLLATPGLVMRVKTDTFRGQATSSNVFAESPGGNPNNVVMVGAHLDSVNAGPGIQDNGSGSAAILEVAEQMAKVTPVNKVRFALWGAEESGLVGSTFYVASLPQAERDKIALYLNFDMIGSPNHVLFIYDGDNSDGVGAPAGPLGSAQIETLFERFYGLVGESYKGTDFSGRSDYGPFIAPGVDIPSGGLFTGAEGVKTVAEAVTWGGVAGQQYDPCYHLACDNYANINLHAYDVNTNAVAFATLTYAFSTESVNGVPGKIVPGSPSVGSGSGNSAGYPGGSQGGLHDDDHIPVDS